MIRPKSFLPMTVKNSRYLLCHTYFYIFRVLGLNRLWELIYRNQSWQRIRTKAKDTNLNGVRLVCKAGEPAWKIHIFIWLVIYEEYQVNDPIYLKNVNLILKWTNYLILRKCFSSFYLFNQTHVLCHKIYNLIAFFLYYYRLNLVFNLESFGVFRVTWLKLWNSGPYLLFLMGTLVNSTRKGAWQNLKLGKLIISRSQHIRSYQ